MSHRSPTISTTRWGSSSASGPPQSTTSTPSWPGCWTSLGRATTSRRPTVRTGRPGTRARRQDDVAGRTGAGARLDGLLAGPQLDGAGGEHLELFGRRQAGGVRVRAHPQPGLDLGQFDRLALFQPRIKVAQQGGRLGLRLGKFALQVGFLLLGHGQRLGEQRRQ